MTQAQVTTTHICDDKILQIYEYGNPYLQFSMNTFFIQHERNEINQLKVLIIVMCLLNLVKDCATALVIFSPHKVDKNTLCIVSNDVQLEHLSLSLVKLIARHIGI